MLILRESAGRASNWQRLRLTALAASAALAFIVVGLICNLPGILQSTGLRAFPETDSGISTTLESNHGRKSSILLSDGTTVLLDADSAIKIAYQANMRGVLLLRGRAKFDVAKDAQHPFLVKANGRTVTALGTSFSVNIAAQSVQVGLIEGKVHVADNSLIRRSVNLNAGQFLNAADDDWTVEYLSTKDLLAWTNDILIFEDQKLADIVDEVNRYSKNPIVFVGPKVKDHRMSAVLRAGDIETLVAGVKTFGIAHVNYSKSGQIILSE
jgi:transmembrane sensor